MNLPAPAAQRLARYLHEVELHLAHKSPAVRRELLNELRDHALEALRHARCVEPTVADVERVLATMDEPACFAENPNPAPAPPPSSARLPWLAIALAFLAVNTYGVWKWTRPPAPPPAALPVAGPVDISQPAAVRPLLSLTQVEQINLTAAREVTLRLVFSAPPDRLALPSLLRLSEEDDPELTYELVGQAGSNVVLIKTEMVNHDTFNLRLAAGLASLDHAFAPGGEQSTTVAVRTDFQFLRMEAESPAFESCELRILFNARAEANGLAALVEVDPPVAFNAEVLDSWRGNGVRLTGDFKPGAVYTVTLSPGLTAENGSVLARDIARTVQFPNRPSSLSFATTGRYLSPRGNLRVPVSAVNLESFEISLQPVFANNLVQLAHRDAQSYAYYGGLIERLAGTAVTRTNTIVSAPNQEARVQVNLRDFAGPEPRGVYWMAMGSEKGGSDERLIVITDLGLAARVAPGGVLVWVNSLREARPVRAAEVVLYGDNNQEIARGITDASGLVLLPRGDDDEPFVVTAQKDADLTYLDLSRTRVGQGEELGGAAYLGQGEVEAAVFTERGVYRPGETVFLQALVRDRQMNAPTPFPALFRVRKPDGRIFKDLPVTLDALGSAQTNVVLPAYLPTGRYTLELALPGTFTVLGETVVALEDFVPPQIRVDLEAPPQRLAAGTALSFRVKSAHLFGRAASGLKANGFVTIKPAPFAPAAWKGWTFGDDEKPFSPVYRQLGTQVLDEQGTAQFKLETSAAWRPPAALQAVQQAVVVESSGRTVTSYGSSPIDVYPFYIGLRLSQAGTLRVGETQQVSVVEVSPDGAAAGAEKPLVVKLARVQWSSVLKRNQAGRYEWKSERQLTVLREDTMAVGGQPRVWPFAVDRTGEYLLLATDPASGASSSLRFSAAAADQAWVEWSREQPDRVELSLDRESYRPGDTARLLIKAPFSGTALLTIESDRVLEQRVLTLEKNTAEIEVPVKAAFAPNVYCALTVIRPAVAESVWSAHRAVGAIALPVQPAARRLAVALEVAATNRPQARMPVRVTVRDEAGAPVSGQVTVMAVDEAICMLTGFTTPDPLGVFLAQRRLGVELFDLYRELMPVPEGAVAGASHTGGDDAASLRRRLNPIKANRFKPVALWQARVDLDTNGQAAVGLEVPEFSGELRVMAVAYNAGQAGSAEQPVKVKRSLVVQPSLPRFLATGDRCVALVDLFNESGQEAALQVRITCGGPLQAPEAEQAVVLAAGASRVLQVPLQAGLTPGKALCTIEVEGASERYRETIELAVRPAAGLQVQTAFHQVAAGESIELSAPPDWLAASVAQQVQVSGQPTLRLGRALDYVMNYPYGCLEQTVSGAFPLLYAADLANRLLPKSAAAGDLNGYIQSGLLRVLSMQQGDGSFALWPFERGTDRGASLYAAHFLVEARKAAYAVPVDRVEAALKWLGERLDRGVITEVDPNDAAWADDLQERAYACYVLALAGRPNHGWNARLREQAPRLRFAAQVHTAAALLLSGEPRQATELLSQLGLPLARPRDIGGLLNSEVRDAALLLTAWLEVDPQHEVVARLVQYLDSRQVDGHWGTTQDNAMALLALGKYAQRVPADLRPFTGSLALPGGHQRGLASTQEVQVALAPGEGGASRVTNRGPGPMYVSARYEGVSTAPEPDLDRGLSIRREFLNLRGEAMEVSALPQGELVIVRLTVTTQGRALDNLAIEELLPAGWEIENPNLATAQQFGWITQKSDWCRSREIRDDRLVLFTGSIGGVHVFHYAARAVTPGVFVYPPVTAACMYEPEIRSVSGGRTVEVLP